MLCSFERDILYVVKKGCFYLRSAYNNNGEMAKKISFKRVLNKNLIIHSKFLRFPSNTLLF